jgi:hypothetical protein
VSALVRPGRSIKEVQPLARHAKIETSLKRYTKKLAAHDLDAAFESLPDLGPPSRPESLAATGTAGRSGPACWWPR